MPRPYRLARFGAPGEGVHVVLLSLAWILNAGAHPSGAVNASDPNGGMPGQRLEVNVAPGHLRVDYYVEIAAIRLYKEAKAEGATGPAWAAARVETLRPGVRARWNDADLPLTPIPVEEPAQLKETAYVEMHLAGETTLPADTGALNLRMDNFADEPCFYAVSVAVDGGFVVTQTDLGHVTGGRLRDNHHGAWRRDDVARSTNLSIRPTRLWESHASGPLPERLEGIVPGAVPAWIPMAAIALVVAVSAAVGWRRWRRAPKPRSSAPT